MSNDDLLSIESLIIEALFKDEKIRIVKPKGKPPQIDKLPFAPEHVNFAIEVLDRLKSEELNGLSIQTVSHNSYCLTEEGETVLNNGIPEFQLWQAIGNSGIVQKDVEQYFSAKKAKSVWSSCVSHRFIQYNPSIKAFSRHTNPTKYNNSIKEQLSQVMNQDHTNLKAMLDKGYIAEQEFTDYTLETTLGSVKELRQLISDNKKRDIVIPKTNRLQSLKDLSVSSIMSNNLSWKSAIPNDCVPSLSLQQSKVLSVGVTVNNKNSYESLYSKVITKLVLKIKEFSEFPTWKQTLAETEATGITVYLSSNRYEMSTIETLVSVLIHRNGSHKGLKSILHTLVPEITKAYWRTVLCYIYWNLGMPELSEKYFLKEIATIGDNKEYVMFCYCELARMWRHYGNAQKACFYYSKLEEFDASFAKYSLALQSFVFLEMQDIDKAKELMEQAIQLGYDEPSCLIEYHCLLGNSEKMIPYKHILEEELRASFDTLVHKSILFDYIWHARLPHIAIAGSNPFGSRSGDAVVDNEGIVTINYAGCIEPAFPLISLHIENGRLTRDNLYRYGVIPTVPKKARHLTGKLDPLESFVPVELLDNKQVRLLSLHLKGCLYLFFVDCASNMVTKEVELSQFFSDTFYNGLEGIVKRMDYYNIIDVDNRFVLISLSVNVGISGESVVYIVDLELMKVVMCFKEEPEVELFAAISLPGQSSLAVLLGNRKLKYVVTVTNEGKLGTRFSHKNVKLLHNNFFFAIESDKIVMVSLTTEKSQLIDFDFTPENINYLFKNYYVVRSIDEDNKIAIIDILGNISLQISTELAESDRKIFNNDKYALIAIGSNGWIVQEIEGKIVENSIKIPNLSIFDVKFLKNSFLLSTIGNDRSELFQISYEGEILKTFPLLAAWSYSILYDEQRGMAIITDEGQATYAFKVTD